MRVYTRNVLSNERERSEEMRVPAEPESTNEPWPRVEEILNLGRGGVGRALYREFYGTLKNLNNLDRA